MEKETIRKRVEYWKTRKVEAVINSSPSIYLAKTGALDFLGIYSNVYMPEIVKTEVVDAGKRVSAPDALFLENAIEEGRIFLGTPSSKKLYNTLLKNPLIQKADAQAIALADEKKAVLIMDDSRGIEIARMMNIEVEPTLTVILIGYALGISDYTRTKEIYKNLLSTKFRISALEYEKALRYLEILRGII
ncbi:hypothetical protein [Candidatus Pyrohabitans sp.]